MSIFARDADEIRTFWAIWGMLWFVVIVMAVRQRIAALRNRFAEQSETVEQGVTLCGRVE